MTRPLGHLRSYKLRLGLLIVLAIAVTLATMVVAGALDVRVRWAVLLAIALALGVVQLVARGTVAPVRRLRDGAQRVAAGEHGVRVPVEGWDELADLGRAFNEMAAELERADAARRALVADAAHELRTPISALRAVLENAVDGVGTADPAALLAQVRRLGDLADRLLDLSQLEDGTAVLRRREVAVRELVDAAVAATASGPVGPAVDVDPDHRVRVDPERAVQVLANLLTNAHRHAPGAAVAVRASRRPGGGTRIVVEDDGDGLRLGEEERVFERFARSDRSRSVPGSGLGLAIARSIVELHGGAVHAERAVPRGCRIVVDLP